MSQARSLAELRAQVAALGKPLAKCEASSPRERCEDRAVAAFKVALEASALSQRAAARRLGICERIVRDYLSGARQIPVWAVAALPIDGQIAFARAFAAEIRDEQDADDLGARCA
jgi:hypothetical protein